MHCTHIHVAQYMHAWTKEMSSEGSNSYWHYQIKQEYGNVGSAFQKNVVHPRHTTHTYIPTHTTTWTMQPLIVLSLTSSRKHVLWDSDVSWQVCMCMISINLYMYITLQNEMKCTLQFWLKQELSLVGIHQTYTHLLANLSDKQIILFVSL